MKLIYKRVAFSSFSYISKLPWLLIEIMPPFIRNLIFKTVCKEYGKGTYIDYKVYIRYPWKLKIGSNVTINQECKFYPSQQIRDAYIEIHDNVVISPQVTFFSAGHDYRQLFLPDIAATIVVEKNSWIGGNSIIMPGVKIGEGAVIGAGSVVTKNIPPWTIAFGNPAKVIKKRRRKC